MRYEFIEPFVHSTLRVLDSVLHSEVTRGDLTLVREADAFGDVSIVIKVMDETEGNIILSMSEETAVSVCGKMNSTDFKTLTPLGMDTISELANMIAGNATSTLNEMGHDFKLYPPMIVRRGGDSASVETEVFQIPLKTVHGDISVSVAMRTS